MRGFFGGYNAPMSVWDMAGQGLLEGFRKGQEDKNMAGAWDALSAYSNQLDDPSLVSTPQIQSMKPQGQVARTQAVNNIKQSGLLPSTDFLGQQATSDNIGKGLLSGMQAATPSYSPGGAQQGLVTAEQQQQGAPPAQPGQYDFKATYTEDNPDNPYSKANNPTQTTYQPKNIAEVKRSVMSTVPSVMKQLTTQFGAETAKAMMPQVLQMAQDRIAQHTYDYNQRVMSDATELLNRKDANERTAAEVAFKLSQIGVKVPNGFIQAYKNPDMKHVIVNTGGKQVLFSYNPKNGDFIEKNSIDNTMTPFQATEVNMRENNTWNPPRVSGGGRGGGAGTGRTPKLGKAESWAAGYENNGLIHDNAVIDTLYGKDFLSSSEQMQLSQALARRDRYWQVSSGGEYGNDSGQTQSSQQTQPSSQQSGDDAGLTWYVNEANRLMNKGYTQQEAEARLTEMINGR